MPARSDPKGAEGHRPLIWWEELKQADLAAGGYANKSRAAITIVHNEPVFLPIWLRYYARFFGAEDLYVLDNDTTGGSTDGDGFVRIPVSCWAL